LAYLVQKIKVREIMKFYIFIWLIFAILAQEPDLDSGTEIDEVNEDLNLPIVPETAPDATPEPTPEPTDDVTEKPDTSEDEPEPEPVDDETTEEKEMEPTPEPEAGKIYYQLVGAKGEGGVKDSQVLKDLHFVICLQTTPSPIS